MKKGVLFKPEGVDWYVDYNCGECHGISHKFWFTGKYKSHDKDNVLAEFKSKICSRAVFVKIAIEDFAEMTKPD